jgi:hypothetical protein
MAARKRKESVVGKASETKPTGEAVKVQTGDASAVPVPSEVLVTPASVPVAGTETVKIAGVYDDLVRLPGKTPLSVEGLAKLLDRDERTIRRFVASGDVPAPFMLGSSPMWIAERVLAYFDTLAERAERKAEQKRAHLRKYEDT